MNLTTIIGIAAGAACIIISIALQGDLSYFYNLNSIFITVGGTFAAIIASNTFHRLINTLKALPRLMINKSPKPEQAIETIVDLAQTARKEGLLKLEEVMEECNDRFLSKGIRLVVDGIEPEQVRLILESDIDGMEGRHAQVWKVLDGAAAYAPAFGMIGTLIGLISMLQKLTDPEALGPGMSVALVTTFYGSLLANVVFSPMASTLRAQSDVETLYRQIIMDGVLAIQSGTNPYVIREKLAAYLPAPKPVKEKETEEDEEEEEIGETAQSG
jgi:chemotaxis protein MotA